MNTIKKIKTYLLGILDYFVMCVAVVGCFAIVMVFMLSLGLYLTLTGDTDRRDKFMQVNFNKDSK